MEAREGRLRDGGHLLGVQGPRGHHGGEEAAGKRLHDIPQPPLQVPSQAVRSSSAAALRGRSGRRRQDDLRASRGGRNIRYLTSGMCPLHCRMMYDYGY